MTKVFISQPMNGIADDAIITRRQAAMAWLSNIFPDLEVIDSFIAGLPNEPTQGREPLIYLSKSIEKLAEADVMLQWGNCAGARGCVIERDVAMLYGIPIIRNGGLDD